MVNHDDKKNKYTKRNKTSISTIMHYRLRNQEYKIFNYLVLALSARKRKTKASNLKIRYNCLQAGHSVAKCKGVTNWKAGHCWTMLQKPISSPRSFQLPCEPLNISINGVNVTTSTTKEIINTTIFIRTCTQVLNCT